MGNIKVLAEGLDDLQPLVEGWVRLELHGQVIEDGLLILLENYWNFGTQSICYF